MKVGQKHAAALGVALMIVSGFAGATSTFDSLTAVVSFSDFVTALSVVYAGMITTGLFLKGGNMIARKLGFR
ncbi:hypothetical protein [Methylomonas sp. CM2]|uniref:hypothetical protein n=1 Tax=Methylomonas sp. CM2 TaxID=3417647 RepID=UPI003CEBB618